MNLRRIYPRASTLVLILSLAVWLAAATVGCASAQSLQVTFGEKGVQTLSYAGTSLEDLGTYPGDLFHIWHTRLTDLNGNVLNGSQGQYGWGENNSGEAWNAATQTETYTFSWGAIGTQFIQRDSNLDMIVTETNNQGSGVILDGAEIYPLALHFPQDPSGFHGYSQYAITTLGPGVSAADFGSGVVTSAIPNEAVPLYGGWKGAGTNTYTPLMTGTAPDGLPTFLPSINAAVAPGTSLTYTVSLRFTREGTAADLRDAYASFAQTYPSQMTWSDRRAIGTAYLASSPSGNSSEPGGFPSNPRRYFNDPSVNITDAPGLQAFQDRMLAQAESNATNAHLLNAQAVITWDIEGEQYPQSTSYVCSPDQVATAAPEMESIVTDSSSGYQGEKLDDAYFKIMTNAGLRIGLCLRPQVFAIASDGTASQTYLSTNAAIIGNLEAKARFANSRWGATIFYVDSTVDTTGGTLDPAIFEQLITDLPGFLFIPEESTPRYYAYSAPFYSFIFHTTLGTPASTYSYYPKAFGANLINDVSASTLAQYQSQLTQAVRQGDILMGHVDYWQANDPTIVSIYQAAGVSAPPIAKTAPTVTWADPSPIPYGTPLSTQQLDATANVPGSFVYTPSLGTILSQGSDTLLVTFNPTDSTHYTMQAASVILTVNPAEPVSKKTPVLSWPPPSAISYGVALSNQQLDATANIPGTFVYTPPAGNVPGAGSIPLLVFFTPADTTDYTTQTASVTLTVNPAPVSASPLSILSPAAGAALTATIMVSGQCTLTLDSAGTYLMVDGQEVGTRRVTGAPYVYPLDTTTLSNGSHILQLWGHDIGNQTIVSAPVAVTVTN